MMDNQQHSIDGCRDAQSTLASAIAYVSTAVMGDRESALAVLNGAIEEVMTEEEPRPDVCDQRGAIVALGGTVELFDVDGEAHYEVTLDGRGHGPMVETELFWFARGLTARG